MRTFKELQKEQEDLNSELLECPKCGVICRWQEIIEGFACVGYYYKSKEEKDEEKNKT